MGKHRAKRFSGALDRYLKDPDSSLRPLSEKIKVTNPQAEFEVEQKKVFIPSAVEPKPQFEAVKEPITLDKTFAPIDAKEMPIADSIMPLYCNHCDLAGRCPDAKGKFKRKDQKELIVCTRRAEFKNLIGDAGTNSRNGLIDYIHKLRQINSIRIGQMLYKEALSNSGADRNLTTLIDKQIETALAEYKLLTPQEKNVNNFSLRLSYIHKTVDTYNELPAELKGHILATLKNKLAEIKAPLTASRVIEIGKEEVLVNVDNENKNANQLTSNQDNLNPDINQPIKHDITTNTEHSPRVSAIMGGGGKDKGKQDEPILNDEAVHVEDL